MRKQLLLGFGGHRCVLEGRRRADVDTCGGIGCGGRRLWVVDESDESNESGVSVRLAWTLAGWGYDVDRINSCSGGVEGGRDRR